MLLLFALTVLVACNLFLLINLTKRLNELQWRIEDYNNNVCVDLDIILDTLIPERNGPIAGEVISEQLKKAKQSN